MQKSGFAPFLNYRITVVLWHPQYPRYLWRCYCVWICVHHNQRPDQYKMIILVFSIQYDFQILKYQYQYQYSI